MEEIWKSIKNYSNYECSNLGNVRNKKTKELVKQDLSYKNKNIKNYYRINIKPDKGHYKTFFTHVLICLVFNGNKPISIKNEKWVVNHKDNDKHNNKADNLEWITQSNNMFHAIENGMRKDNIPVFLINNITKIKTQFYSINSLSKFLNIPRSKIYTVIANHQDKLYKNIYTFKIFLGRLGLVKRNSSEFKVYDYNKKKWLYPLSINHFALISGLTPGVIKYRIKNEKDEILNGKYILRSIENNNIPIFTKELVKFF